MLLSAEGITRELKKGTIIISPFNECQLNPNSYDLRLGNWFVKPKKCTRMVDFEDSHMVEDLWNEPVFVYDIDDYFTPNHHDKGVIQFILEPYQYILATTKEIAGSNQKYSTLLKSRSTAARAGLDICASAGFGDVGYVNHWTLEIRNLTDNHIILKPGMRLVQLAFIKLDGKSQILYNGAYKQSQIWLPQMMLPKLGQGRV